MDRWKISLLVWASAPLVGLVSNGCTDASVVTGSGETETAGMSEPTTLVEDPCPSGSEGCDRNDTARPDACDTETDGCSDPAPPPNDTDQGGGDCNTGGGSGDCCDVSLSSCSSDQLRCIDYEDNLIGCGIAGSGLSHSELCEQWTLEAGETSADCEQETRAFYDCMGFAPCEAITDDTACPDERAAMLEICDWEADKPAPACSAELFPPVEHACGPAEDPATEAFEACIIGAVDDYVSFSFSVAADTGVSSLYEFQGAGSRVRVSSTGATDAGCTVDDQVVFYPVYLGNCTDWACVSELLYAASPLMTCFDDGDCE